jgi:uncharacterized protein
VILYVESSGLLGLYLQEGDRRAEIIRAVELASVKYTSPLSLVEVRSGLARARYRDNPPRLRAAGYARALTDFLSDWDSFFFIEIDRRILERAGALAEQHRLRAYDAVHLAAALELSDTATDSVRVSTWDRELAAAAEAEGLSLAHEVTN